MKRLSSKTYYIFIGAAAAILLLLASGGWQGIADWRAAHACPLFCTHAQQTRPVMEKRIEPITTQPPQSKDAREKYHQRNLYRQRQMIGWT
jgi:hypothetical protein